MRWFREPLWHFVVLGGGLFALHRATEPDVSARRVVVTASVQRALQAEHLQRYGAPPTPDQTQALVDRWVDDEVRVREALALGLEREDLIVRRRLIQKMDFLLEDATPLARATDAELEAWMAAHPTQYAVPDRVSFEHVFAASDRHPADAEGLVGSWRMQLAAGASPATLGDPFMRGRAFVLLTQGEVAAIFGAEFAAALSAAEVGQWSEPVRSSYGWHSVRLSERVTGRPPTLLDVRAAVERDWRDARRATLDQAALRSLRAQYEIATEAPSP